MYKKKIIAIFATLLLIFGGSLSTFHVAHAEDDDNEVDDDAPKTTTTTSKPKTYTETVVVTPARTVTEDKIETISSSDRDRDGFADSEDLHPDIAEIYIVKDDNFNGIVDTFEYGS